MLVGCPIMVLILVGNTLVGCPTMISILARDICYLGALLLSHYDLNSCRGHLLVGCPIMIPILLVVGLIIVISLS